MIELRTMGALSLTHDDGREVRSVLAQPKRLALLAYLTSPATAEFTTRETLLGLFWPDVDPEHARGALRTALSFLRRSLRSGTIVHRGEHEVGIDAGRLRCDVAEFERKLEVGEVEAALELYGGPYLHGLGIDEAPGFERWLEAERARLQHRARDAALDLARAASELGQWRDAETWARRALAIDHWYEPALRVLMNSLVEAGNAPEALLVFDHFSEQLAEELELEPSPETRALITRIREEGPRPDPDLPSRAPDEAEESARRAPEAGNEPVSPPQRRTSRVEPSQPEEQRESPMKPQGSERPTSRVWYRVLWSVLLALLALAAVARWLPSRQRQREGTGADVIRIAVLPLENLGDENAGYFATGLSEEILQALAQVDRFLVPGPSSSFVYQGRDHQTEVRQIARELGVDYLLVGSVRKDDERLRASVMLVDRSDHVLWSSSYDTRLSGELTAEEQIARAVIEELRPRLAGSSSPPALTQQLQPRAMSLSSPDAKYRPLASRTRSPDAHDHYLRAIGQVYARSPRNLKAALRELQQAVALDSTYARAYAAMADVYNTMGAYDYGIMKPSDAYPAARAAAERALALEPGLAEAHAVLGVTLFNYAWEWGRAEKELRTALELNPGDAMARHWYALLLRVTGRGGTAMAQIHEAQDRDPRNPVISTSLCRQLYFERRFDEALGECRRALSLDSMYVQAYLALGLVQVQRREIRRALDAYRRASRQLGRDDLPMIVALRAHAYGVAGDTLRAQQLYEALSASALRHAEGSGPYIPPHWLALAAIGAGLPDLASRWLEMSLEQHSDALLYLNVEPVIDPLREAPHFQRLLHEAREAGLGPVLPARTDAPARGLGPPLARP